MSVVALDAVGDAALVGGKARGLGQLLRLGLPVPEALVLTTDAHERWCEQGHVADEDRRELADALARLGAPLAVRSSAADEDGGDRSAAGQYESVMGVRDLDGLLAAVERCWREDGRAGAYRGDAPARLALVLQREVAADRAAIAFSVDPVTGDRDAVLIEAVFGHGEGAVGGTVTPDRYRVERGSEAVSARVADKPAAADGSGRLAALVYERRTARTLRDDEARAVAALALAAERALERAVDVELCFERGTLWAVQCRPITTLA